MRLHHVTLVFLIALAPLTAQAHNDAVPYALDGKIVTGGHDDALGTDTISTRVFGYDFGEDPFDPYFIGDPGFNNGAFAAGLYPNNGLLPVGKTLAFDVVTNLQYWDGTGSVAFSAAPAGVELGLARGSFEVQVSGTGQSGSVPSIGSTGAGGRLHVHLGSNLYFNDSTNPSAPNAPDGIYLVGLKLKLTDGSLLPSDTIYLVYNGLLDEETHDEAIDWVQTNLVPEPATWVLMAGAVVSLAPLVRRRLKAQD